MKTEWLNVWLRVKNQPWRHFICYKVHKCVWGVWHTWRVHEKRKENEVFVQSDWCVFAFVFNIEIEMTPMFDQFTFLLMHFWFAYIYVHILLFMSSNAIRKLRRTVHTYPACVREEKKKWTWTLPKVNRKENKASKTQPQHTLIWWKHVSQIYTHRILFAFYTVYRIINIHSSLTSDNRFYIDWMKWFCITADSGA